MIKNKFVRSNYDSCVYVKWVEEGLGVFFLLYVDDMLITSKDKEEIGNSSGNWGMSSK